jgi:hypothetical protein
MNVVIYFLATWDLADLLMTMKYFTSDYQTQNLYSSSRRSAFNDVLLLHNLPSLIYIPTWKLNNEWLNKYNDVLCTYIADLT